MDVGDGVSSTLAHQRVAHWTRDTFCGASGSHLPQCLTVGFRRSHHQQTFGLLVASVPWHFVFRLALKRNNPLRFIRTAGTTTSTMAVQASFSSELMMSMPSGEGYGAEKAMEISGLPFVLSIVPSSSL